MIPIKDENPTHTFPIVTIILIAVNVLVFLYQVTLPERGQFYFTARYGAIPIALTHFVDPFPNDGFPVALTLVTSAFLHGGWLHLGGNMLYLWIFGNNIEDALGHFRFILFYILCGVAATLFFVGFEYTSRTPLIGASGAIAGVMGAYLVLFPRARVLTLFLIIIYPLFVWIPAVVILLLWLVVQFLNVGSGMESNVAWAAHIGGFITGMIAIKLMIRRRPPPSPPRPMFVVQQRGRDRPPSIRPLPPRDRRHIH